MKKKTPRNPLDWFKIRDRNGRIYVRCANGAWLEYTAPATPRNVNRLKKTLKDYGTNEFSHGDMERLPRERYGKRAYGVELEGLWFDRNESIKYDASVEFEDADSGNQRCSCGSPTCGNFDEDIEESDGDNVGEIASPILYSPREVKFWTRENYPDRVNNSCGLHIHFSGIDWRKVSKRSTDQYLRMIQKLKLDKSTARQLEARIDGNNTYCKRGVGYNDRYYQFNMTAINKFGTMEIRVLPMAAHLADAHKMLDFTTRYALRNWKHKRPNRKGKETCALFW